MAFKSLLVFGVLLLGSASAVALIPSDPGSVKAASKMAADNLMQFYNFAQVGVLPAPYFWWETAGMLGGMIEYWHFTGDGTYNDQVGQGIISQRGPNNDFQMPQCDGNDDQAWWGLTAMSAAEYGFPQPANSPSWISLAENVFREFQGRWDMSRCNGGMKWKIAPDADGFHYKSTIANGLAFQLAARLARFTGNQDYATWATNTFEWVQSVGLLDHSFNVFDGTDDAKGTGCIDVNHDQWSYNVGAFMYGSAIMHDITLSPVWSDRAAGLLGNAVSTFHQNRVMFEKQCEPKANCNVDQASFKAYLARWMANTAVLIPSFQAAIQPFLTASAQGAAAACTGGGNGQMCGSRWTAGFDGLMGVGQQLGAMEVIQAALVPLAKKPFTATGR